jgi:Sec-independent protein translocase protein TatA
VATKAPALRVGLTQPPQIAKNLGQTLRAFQPTIKELQQVSQDFKSALDQEVSTSEARVQQERGADDPSRRLGSTSPSRLSRPLVLVLTWTAS